MCSRQDNRGSWSSRLAFVMRQIEQGKSRPQHAFKQRTFRRRACKNADAKEHSEQQACRIIRIDPAWGRSVGMRGANAPFEKSLDLAKLFSNQGAKLALMWRHLERGIDKEASFALSIVDRVVNDLGAAP
jgi:hypothetical protein